MGRKERRLMCNIWRAHSEQTYLWFSSFKKFQQKATVLIRNRVFLRLENIKHGLAGGTEVCCGYTLTQDLALKHCMTVTCNSFFFFLLECVKLWNGCSTSTCREETKCERRGVSQLDGNVDVGHGGGDHDGGVQVRETPDGENGGQII